MTARFSKVLPWLGPLLLLALVAVVASATELRGFATLLAQVRPAWLLLALVLQSGTYLAHAAVWWASVRRMGERLPLSRFAALSLSQQFVNQTLPSGGLSGVAAIAGFMRRRGVSEGAVALAFGVNLIGFYFSYFLALAAALVVIWLNHSLHATLLYLALGFTVAAVAVLALFAYGWVEARRGTPPRFFAKYKSLMAFFQAIEGLPRGILFEGVVLVPATLLLASIFVFDSATLWVVLEALGTPVAFPLVFAAHVISSIAAMALLVPGGVGVFEGSLTVMLGLFGLATPAALAAAILFRGFTYWLPLLPGYFVTRLELAPHEPSHAIHPDRVG